MATKRYEQAVRAYLDSRKAFNDAVAAEKFDAATVDRRLSDRLQALREYGRALQRGSATQAQGLTAAIQRNQEEIRQTESMLNRAKSGVAPDPPPGLSMALGSAYFRTGDLKSAEREYLDAVTAKPSFGEAHSNLAVVYMMTGRLEHADQEIALAEKAGFSVNPQLKADIRKRLGR
jgi:Flp pilus assembly protein TadD